MAWHVDLDHKDTKQGVVRWSVHKNDRSTSVLQELLRSMLAFGTSVRRVAYKSSSRRKAKCPPPPNARLLVEHNTK